MSKVLVSNVDKTQFLKGFGQGHTDDRNRAHWYDEVAILKYFGTKNHNMLLTPISDKTAKHHKQAQIPKKFYRKTLC